MQLTEVVGYNYDTTGELVDGLGERINRLHIQVICGLVQEQDVRGLECQHGKDDTLTMSDNE
jgi:hypothetical protein